MASPVSSFALSSLSISSTGTDREVREVPDDLPIPPVHKSTATVKTLPMSHFPVALNGLSGLPAASRLSLAEEFNARPNSKHNHDELGVIAGSAAALVRLGFIVDAKEFVEAVLDWKDPTLSALLLTAFLAACAYPILIFVLPQTILALALLFKYISRSANPPPPAPPPVPPPVSDLQSVMQQLGSERYIRNFTFLQNSNGLFCATYDSLASLHEEHLSWRKPEKTLFVLKSLIASIPFCLAAWYFLPGWCIRAGVALGGSCVLLERTWIFVFAVHVAPNVLYQRGLATLEKFVTTLPLPDSVADSVAGAGFGYLLGKSGLNVLTDSTGEGSLSEDQTDDSSMTIPNSRVLVEVYENQRWWAGPGWSSTMLVEERASWSNEAGTLKLIEKSAGNTPPLENHVWLDEDWTLDMEWCATDSDGWIYTWVTKIRRLPFSFNRKMSALPTCSDHNWMHPSSSAAITSLTRRRRWIRAMREISIPPAQKRYMDALRKISFMNGFTSLPMHAHGGGGGGSSGGAFSGRAKGMYGDSVGTEARNMIEDGIKKRKSSVWMSRESVGTVFKSMRKKSVK
ncbi:hypothetical protein HDU81_003613 [Chytriomyces hyalinus]|nr:hypothetical protein HDU81_003613 [Chytriomyces hyalinus]